MTTEEWLDDQKYVWGTGEAFAEAVERLKLAEAGLIRLVEMTPPEDADVLVAGVLDAVAPPDASGTLIALVRFEAMRPAITRRVADALRNGAVPHSVVWIVVNAFLRGDTWAVERVLPDGLRALSCEEWAAEEAAGRQL